MYVIYYIHLDTRWYLGRDDKDTTELANAARFECLEDVEAVQYNRRYEGRGNYTHKMLI